MRAAAPAPGPAAYSRRGTEGLSRARGVAPSRTGAVQSATNHAIGERGEGGVEAEGKSWIASLYILYIYGGNTTPVSLPKTSRP